MTDCVELALRAERWIDSHRVDTEHGVVWGLANEVPHKHFHTLYLGSAGIALFYLELAEATGEARFLDIARAAGRELVERAKTWDTLTCAAMGGWPGYLFVLGTLGARLEDTAFTEAAKRCAQKQRDQAEDIGDGIGWIQEMPYGRLTGHTGLREIYDVAEGAAGAALYWLHAYEQGICEPGLDWSVLVGKRLLQVAEPAEGGLRWQLMEDIPWPFDAPNFAHGTAGVAYFMARLYELTGEPAFLDAALAGAGHVQAVAERIDGGGHLVPHIRDDGRENRFYLGMCHGPAGTARLFYLLGELTADDTWQAWSRGLDEGLLSLGCPEERSRGFWNNVSQCCCDAGIGDYAVSMYRATADDLYLDLAQRVAKELERRAVGEDAVCWPQAEHRSQPDFIQAQTGYMQGAAGVASFLVHLGTTLADRPVKIAFPDSPFVRLDRA